MAKVSSIVLSAATLGFLKLAPSKYIDTIVSALEKSPISPRLLLNIISYYAGFKLFTGLVTGVNDYFSWKRENNWATDDVYDWEKEVVLITGASSGLGEKMALQLADRGIKIIVIDIRDMSEAIKEKYKNIHFYPCDISDFSALSSVAAEIRSDHGDPTVLILNAGIVNLNPILTTTVAQSQKLLNINLTSHIAMMHEFLPSLIKNNHGHVCFIASMCSYISIAGMADYCASKAGTLAYYETLKQELRHVYKAPKVRTSIVHPTWMRTNIVPFEEVEKSKEVRMAKKMFYGVDKAAKMVVDKVLSGYGGRVVVPDVWGMRAMIGVRAWPMWAQEPVRDHVRVIGL